MVGLDKRYNMNRTSNRLWLVGIKQLVDSYLWPLVQLYSAKSCSSFLEWLWELHWVSEENLGLWPLLVVFCLGLFHCLEKLVIAALCEYQLLDDCMIVQYGKKCEHNLCPYFYICQQDWSFNMLSIFNYIFWYFVINSSLVIDLEI